MAALPHAVPAPFDDVERLKHEKFLTLLRTYPDFQRLLAEIEQRMRMGDNPGKPPGP
jgi:hypothetical protein